VEEYCGTFAEAKRLIMFEQVAANVPPYSSDLPLSFTHNICFCLHCLLTRHAAMSAINFADRRKLQLLATLQRDAAR